MAGFVLEQVVTETKCLHMSSTNVCYVNIPTVPGAGNLELQIKVFPSQFALPGVVCS